jgi:hypothetical protein
MEYFLIARDCRIPNYPEPLGISKLSFDAERPEESNPIQLQIRERDCVEYADFIASPVPLVSDELKKLLQQFEKAAVFIPVVLADRKRAMQRLYWNLRPPQVDCLSNHTEFNKNGTVKKFVLNPEPVAGFRMFKIDRVTGDFIVFNLIVVESLLRRKLSGFRFTRIEVEPDK